MGPEPSLGWTRSRHGVGVPFRPGVVLPPRKMGILVAKNENGDPIRVDAAGCGKQLITILRHNPKRILTWHHVDPAGWVSAQHILRHHPMFRGCRISEETLVNLIELENASKVQLLMDWVEGGSGKNELFVKAAQGHSEDMEDLVDLNQMIPVINPRDDKWARVAYHGTRLAAV
eukprot:7515751-Alexandrium_andersonii.AAC.1